MDISSAGGDMMTSGCCLYSFNRTCHILYFASPYSVTLIPLYCVPTGPLDLILILTGPPLG